MSGEETYNADLLELVLLDGILHGATPNEVTTLRHLVVAGFLIPVVLDWEFGLKLTALGRAQIAGAIQ